MHISYIQQMNSKSRKILLSVVIIVALTASAAAATWAYFTATRNTTANRFTAGTLDLNVQTNGAAAESFALDNVGDPATLNGGKTYTVRNTGTLPGRLYIRLKNVANLENGCNDPEIEAEANCEADNNGELGGVVTLKALLGGVEKVSSLLATNQENKLGNDWLALPAVTIAPGAQETVDLNWEVGDYGNEVQSDSTTFDVEFRLVQPNAPAPTPVQ